MQKTFKLPTAIFDSIAKAADYLRNNPHVIFAYLFGSLARGKPVPLSDADIAVFLTEDATFPKAKLEILDCLVEILETDEIDLVILNTASLPLQARIIRYKKTLVDKDPFLRHRFESLILRQYADFSIKEMRIFERRYFGDRQSPHSEKSLRA